MDICTFWWGQRLRRIDAICLRSMIKIGYRVKIFAYRPIDNLPDSVELHDAAGILDERVFLRLDPGYPDLKTPITIQQFSDIFRIALMKNRKGFWLDTDVFMLSRFEAPADRPFVAREDRKRVGVSALYFPPDHPVIGAFDAYLDGDALLPAWLGTRRRVLRPMLFRARGRRITPAEAGITIFGNDGISRLAKKHGFFAEAAPKETFYAVSGKETLKLYDPHYDFHALMRPGIYGIHVHRKEPARLPPRPGSFYAWASDHVRDVP